MAPVAVLRSGRLQRLISMAPATRCNLPARNIIQLYSTIRKDPRHHEVTTISEGDTDSRQFGHWTMAHFRIERGDSGQEEGYLRLMTSFRSADQMQREAGFLEQYLGQLRDLLPAPDDLPSPASDDPLT
jgi:hypothetical protein